MSFGKKAFGVKESLQCEVGERGPTPRSSASDPQPPPNGPIPGASPPSVLPQPDSVTARDQSASFHETAPEGDLEMVKAMIQRKPSVVFNKDDRGRTPLHLAATAGYTAVAQLLLANKALVNAKNELGDTPLRRAAVAGHKGKFCWPTKPM